MEKFRKNDGYLDVVDAVARLVRVSEVRKHLDEAGWPDPRVVEVMLQILKHQAPTVSRRWRWVEAALWERSRAEAGG